MAEAKKIQKSASQPAKKAEPKKATSEKASEQKASPSPKAPKEKKQPQLTPNKMCRDLLLERRYTDEQIAEKVKATFPDAKFDKGYVSTTRIDLNKGIYKTVEEDVSKNPLVRLEEHEGKILPYEKIKELKVKAAEESKKQKAEEAAKKKAEAAKLKEEAAAKKKEEKKAAAEKKAETEKKDRVLYQTPSSEAEGASPKTGASNARKKDPKMMIRKAQ